MFQQGEPLPDDTLDAKLTVLAQRLRQQPVATLRTVLGDGRTLPPIGEHARFPENDNIDEDENPLFPVTVADARPTDDGDWLCLWKYDTSHCGEPARESTLGFQPAAADE